VTDGSVSTTTGSPPWARGNRTKIAGAGTWPAVPAPAELGARDRLAGVTFARA
jgi:hypothetical protein